jgi:hypothetical protein
LKNNLFIPVLSAILLIAIFASCDRKGCTDITAANVCSKCNSDDGSCIYQGNIVVWWNEATVQNWKVNYNTASVNIYIDGVLVNSIPTTTYWLVAPSCRDNGSVTYSKSLGAAQTMAGTVVVKSGNTGAILSTKSFNYNGGMCLQLQIQ